MEWLKNAVLTKANESGENGLNALEAQALAAMLDQFMSDNGELYEYRRGTIILDAQEVIVKNQYQRPSYENLGYGEAKLVLRANLPGGPAETIFFNGDKVASAAIDSLLEGQRLFTGHANASLDGNVYRTSGSEMVYDSGHLMLVNTTYGRFLAGCGDDHAGNSKYGEGDFVFIAIAQALLWMFPTDKLLIRGYDWMRKMSGVSTYHCDLIASTMADIFADKSIAEINQFREYYAEAQSVGITPVPFYRNPAKTAEATQEAAPEAAGAWAP